MQFKPGILFDWCGHCETICSWHPGCGSSCNGAYGCPYCEVESQWVKENIYTIPCSRYAAGPSWHQFMLWKLYGFPST